MVKLVDTLVLETNPFIWIEVRVLLPPPECSETVITYRLERYIPGSNPGTLKVALLA